MDVTDCSAMEQNRSCLQEHFQKHFTPSSPRSLQQLPRVAIGTINSFASDCCVNAGTCICFPFPLRLEAIDEHRRRGGTSRATQPPLALQGFGALGLTLSPQDSPAPPHPSWWDSGAQAQSNSCSARGEVTGREQVKLLQT